MDRALKEAVPEVDAEVYADDATMATDPEPLQRGLWVTEEFTELTGQQVNATKSQLMTTVKRARTTLTFKGEPLTAVWDLRCLGAHLTFHGQMVAGTAAQRLDKACKLAQ